MDGLSASELDDLAGTSTAEVERLVDAGILVARDETGGAPVAGLPGRRRGAGQGFARPVRLLEAVRAARATIGWQEDRHG
jgi:hypothetical protein